MNSTLKDGESSRKYSMQDVRDNPKRDFTPEDLERIKAVRALKDELAVTEDMIDLQKRRAETLLKKSNLGERFKGKTFDTYDPGDNVRAFKTCKAFAELSDYRVTPNSLMICGGYGTGKTHLTAAICNRVLERGMPALFDTFSGHLENLKAEYQGGSQNYLEHLKTVPMLIIDDVGKEKQTEWSTAVMYNVINHRYVHYLPIVITSNFNEEQLADYFGGACYSRLKEMCALVVTTGADKRLNENRYKSTATT